jgi:hypothetical protein
MIERPKGIYRVKRPDGEDDAYLEDKNLTGTWATESLYKARGYEPPWDKLEWRDA